MVLLSVKSVMLIHEMVINENELQGFAGDKSLDAIIGRVDSRIYYGIIKDIYDLAATYAVVISQGHVFNDANKRTAFKAMSVCLELNGINIDFETIAIGEMIVKVAQGIADESELSNYLHRIHGFQS